MMQREVVTRDHWSPSNATAVGRTLAMCRPSRCPGLSSSALATTTPVSPLPTPPVSPPPPPTPPAPSAPAPAADPFLLVGETLPVVFGDRPRLIMWFQHSCIACQTNGPVFDALRRAATDAGYVVHLIEATPDLLRRFPHVTVVPLFDLVDPLVGGSSPYGPGTVLQTLRNELTGLRDRFPALLLSSVGDRRPPIVPPTPPPAAWTPDYSAMASSLPSLPSSLPSLPSSLPSLPSSLPSLPSSLPSSLSNVFS